MSRERWIGIGAWLAVAGGIAWLAKLAVIVATDGRTDDEGAAAVFYLTGFVLLALGSTAVGALVAGDRSRAVLIAGVVPSPLLFIASFALLQAVGQAIVGDRGPAFVLDEIGILLTALCWLAIGLAVTNRGRQTRAALPA